MAESLNSLELSKDILYDTKIIKELTHWKRPWCWKNWRQEKKGMTEGEMVRWHHWLSGHEFEQTLGVGDGQGSLKCCSPWGCKESDMTEPLNWTELNWCDNKLYWMRHCIHLFHFILLLMNDGVELYHCKSSFTVDGNINWCSHYGVWSFLKKPSDPVIPLLGIYPEKTKTLKWKRCMHSSAHSSTICNSQDMEAT